MSWLLFSVIAGVLLAIFYTFVARLSQRDGECYGKFIMAAWLAGTIMLPLAPWHKPWQALGIATIIGMSYGLSGVPFYKAYRHLSGLSVALAAQALPAMVLLPAWLMLNEPLTARQLFAFGLILAGTLTCSLRFGEHLTSSFKGYMLVLLGLLLSAIPYVLVKLMSTRYSMTGFEVFASTRIGIVASVVLLLVLPASRAKMLSLFSLGRRQTHYYVTDFLLVSFSLCALTAIALQPRGMNTGIVNAVYFGTCSVVQLMLHLRSAQHKGLKILGALLTAAGFWILFR